MTDKEDQDKTIDCATDQEREFARNALIEFNKENYHLTLQNLMKLDHRTYDIKVTHNKIVTEYYKSELKKTEQFHKGLTNLCNQSRSRMDKLDDVDHCVVYFNQAVLLYHQCQFTAALRIMEKVYKFIEAMDECLAKTVGLLLLELQISTRQLDKAMGLLSFLENRLFNGTPLHLKLTDKTIKILEREKKDRNKTAPSTDSYVDAIKMTLIKYKARYYLLGHSLNHAEVEIEKLFSHDQNSIIAQLMKANLQYLRGEYNESMQSLNAIPDDAFIYQDCGESSTIMKNNNIGLNYHAMGKFNLACHHFQKALKMDIDLNKSSGEKAVYTLGGSRYHELMYNLGVSLLHVGRPANAFDCLTIAVRRYHRNSRLWLRLAECCIQVHKESNEIDFNIRKKQKEMIAGSIGNKEQHKVLLTSNLSKDKKYNVDGQSSAIPVPTLEFASFCLKNAHLLLPSGTISSPVPLLLIPGVTPPIPPPSPGPAPSAPLSPNAIAELRNAILAANAYVCLCLGDYILAMEHAETLLAQPAISGAHKLLGHLYAAESLILLDKIAEAVDHLNPHNIKDISLECPAKELDEEEELIKTAPPSSWFPTNVESAQAVMHYNLAVCKTLRGQMDQAVALLKQIWQRKGQNCEIPAHILMLVLYIELQLGHTNVARTLIKQYSLAGRGGGFKWRELARFVEILEIGLCNKLTVNYRSLDL